MPGIFDQIVATCWEAGLVKGESVVMDSPTYQGQRRATHNNVTIKVTRRPEAYWDDSEIRRYCRKRPLKRSKSFDRMLVIWTVPASPKAFIIWTISARMQIQTLDNLGRRSVEMLVIMNARDIDIRKKNSTIRYDLPALDSDTSASHYGLTRLDHPHIRPCRRGKRKESKWLTTDYFHLVKEETPICPDGKNLLF